MPSYPPAPTSASGAPTPTPAAIAMYPGLADYMGLELSEETIRQNMPEYLAASGNAGAVAVAQTVSIFFLESRKIADHHSQNQVQRCTMILHCQLSDVLAMHEVGSFAPKNYKKAPASP